VPVGLVLVALVGVLVYLGRPISIWATLGNVVVFAALVLYMAIRSPKLTGRQPYLPALDV